MTQKHKQEQIYKFYDRQLIHINHKIVNRLGK